MTKKIASFLVIMPMVYHHDKFYNINAKKEG